MKIERITYQKAFITGPFLQEKIGFEAEIDEHIQSVHDALMQLKSMAEGFHKEANPHLYQESKTVTSGYYAVDSPYAPAATYSAPGTIPIISKDAEKIEIAIDNATTLEELNKIKDANPVLPYPILLQLNTKMEILRVEANNKSMGKKNSK